jgi:hypothetical protein
MLLLAKHRRRGILGAADAPNMVWMIVLIVAAYGRVASSASSAAATTEHSLPFASSIGFSSGGRSSITT